MFSADKRKVDEILNYYGNDKNGVEPIIMDIHKEYNYLPHSALIYIAYKLNMSHSKIYNIAKLNSKLA